MSENERIKELLTKTRDDLRAANWPEPGKAEQGEPAIVGAAGHDELCCPTCRRPYVLHGIDCPSLSTASAEEAFQGGVDPGPSRYSWRDPECREHPRCASYEGCGGRGYLDDPQDSGSGRTVYCDCAAGVELGERESRGDDEEFRRRRDLSAERYTKPDGSRR